jgi:hypothetical protein
VKTGRKPQGWQRPSTILDAMACPTCYLCRSFETIIDVLLVWGAYVHGAVDEKRKVCIGSITELRKKKPRFR